MTTPGNSRNQDHGNLLPRSRAQLTTGATLARRGRGRNHSGCILPAVPQSFELREGDMYAAIRRYTFDPKNSEQLSTKIQEGFVPLMKKIPGFMAYYWLDSGSGAGTSLSVFDQKSSAEQKRA